MAPKARMRTSVTSPTTDRGMTFSSIRGGIEGGASEATSGLHALLTCERAFGMEVLPLQALRVHLDYLEVEFSLEPRVSVLVDEVPY